MITQEILWKAVRAFRLNGQPQTAVPYGNGHINDTFLVTCDSGSRYILQRMNALIFPRPDHLIHNIERVTAFLREKITAEGGDPARETMRLVYCRDGALYYTDSTGGNWRTYDFVEGTVCMEQVRDAADFRRCAEAFGHFQYQLADFPAQTLCEIIPGFHNTPARYRQLENAVKEDACGRAALVSEEIAFAVAHQADTEVLSSALAAKKLPLRVTHNDTKLNNILFDETDGRALCVIDLDTVMPGLSVTDFGDSIRFGANTAVEDERDLSKVSLDTELFRVYTEGFLKGCGGVLTTEEIAMLPMGAKTMTLECGMRFLTDYLSGDTYFHVHRDGQNLDRCRTQFALVRDMEQKWQELCDIVAHA